MKPMLVGDDPRFILSGRRILEVYWLGYWLPRLDEAARRQLVQDIVALMREGILETSGGQTFSLDEIVTAVTQVESTDRHGKVFLAPGKQ